MYNNFIHLIHMSRTQYKMLIEQKRKVFRILYGDELYLVSADYKISSAFDNIDHLGLELLEV